MSRAKVCQLEAQARAIADHWPDYDADFKYWYNPRCLFQSPAKRVFVGVFPRREGDSWKRESLDYLDYSCEGEIYNEWIDGEWEGKGPEHQRLARVVYEELYGRDEWESKLRASPSFNVMPLRSYSVEDIPDAAWDKAAEWFLEVLDHLKPQLIICNGNGKHSAWNILKPAEMWSEQVGNAKAYLRLGKVTLASGHHARVIGMPLLSGARYGRDDLFELIRQNKSRLLGH